MADSTLAAIRKKVRRLTRSPSTTQLSNTEIDEYVNTFIQYDLPEHLKLFTNTQNFVFYTEPDIDTYGTSVINPNIYINVDKPIYVGGIQATFLQSQEQFYGLYPKTIAVSSIGQTGDGATLTFTGTLSSIPVLKNNVSFSAIDSSNDGLELHDNGSGTLSGDGSGTINYITGAYSLTFSSAPASGNTIYSHTHTYQASCPDTLMYFNNTMVVRPVPDKSYRVEMQVYVRPSELLSSSSSPDLEQWWQYIAYGASKKIFEDRTDMESVALIIPEMKQQEILANRRTIKQISQERTATIYCSPVQTHNPWRE